MPPRFLFRLFPLAAGASNWLEQRLSAPGRLLLGLMIAGAILGIDIGETLGYQIAVLAFALLATSAVLCLTWRPRLSVRRVLPPVVTATVPTQYWIEITNHGGRLERDLIVLDGLRNPPLSHAEFQRLRHGSGEHTSNSFDRIIGFPRWVTLRRHGRGADLAPQPVLTLAAGATVRVKVDVTAIRRGWLRFESLRILRPDPLGLCRAQLHVGLIDALLALPRRHAMPRVQLRSERRYQQGGISLALAVGDSQEFAALRDYRPGDARRHIHWRSFAKTGKLIVKQYQDEYFDRHALVVDTHLPANEGTLFEAVIEVAASIVGGERPRDSILDLIIAGTDILQLSAGRGLGDGLRALTYLAEARATDGDDFGAVRALVRSRLGQLASLILVLGRWDAARQTLIAELAGHDRPALCLLVIHDGTVPTAALQQGSGRIRTIRVEHLAADLAQVELRA